MRNFDYRGYGMPQALRSQSGIDFTRSKYAYDALLDVVIPNLRQMNILIAAYAFEQYRKHGDITKNLMVGALDFCGSQYGPIDRRYVQHYARPLDWLVTIETNEGLIEKDIVGNGQADSFPQRNTLYRMLSLRYYQTTGQPIPHQQDINYETRIFRTPLINTIIKEVGLFHADGTVLEDFSIRAEYANARAGAWR